MPDMPWFRFYSEALADRKVARACRIAEQPKAVIIGTWVTLLCLANDSPERGKLMISDDMWLTPDEVQAETGLDPVTFDRVISAFQKLNMLAVSAGYEVLNWSKRQYKSDNSTARVHKHRAKKRAEKEAVKQQETNVKRFRNVIDTDTDKNRTYIESETPQNGTEKNTHIPWPEHDPAETPSAEYYEKRRQLVSAISSVVKTVCAPGKTEQDFNNIASALLKQGATVEQVEAFGPWWNKNGHYKGKPALTSFIQEFNNMGAVEQRKEYGYDAIPASQVID